MKWFHWLGFMVVGAAFVWLGAMAIHSAGAVEASGPKWKIIVTMTGPPGKQELTYGNQETGVHWFFSEDECQAARKGGDKNFAQSMKLLAAQMADWKKKGLPIEVTTACVPDNSI